MKIAEITDGYGEFSVMLPDGTIVFCCVNSESREDAMFVVNTINALPASTGSQPEDGSQGMSESGTWPKNALHVFQPHPDRPLFCKHCGHEKDGSRKHVVPHE